MTINTIEGFNPQPVILRGQHVKLEPLTLAHAPALFAVGQEPSVWQWLPCSEFDSLVACEVWIKQALQGAEVPFVIVRLVDGQVVGSTRFMDIHPERAAAEIGWTWLASSAHRSPVNTECKYLLLSHLFEQLQAERVCLKTDIKNVRSQRAIMRIGAVQEGVFRRHMRRSDGSWRDSVYFSIVKPEWPAVKRQLQALLQRIP